MNLTATIAEAYQLFHEGSLALARAERQGIRVDLDYCERKKKHLTRQIARLQRKIEGSSFYRRWLRIYGTKTNIYSNHQLSRLLYQKMKIDPPKTTEAGFGSTDEEALRRIDIPELQMILTMRKLAKMRDTYLDAFVREQHAGYIHPTFDLHKVRTFRSSSSGPNFQNIPNRDPEAMKICRRALMPRPGHQLLEMDFASLEVNISACYHHDPTMLRYLEDPKADMHSDMAKQIFLLDDLDRKISAHDTLRQGAKNGFVFPQFYGDYYANNAESLCEWAKLPQAIGIPWAEGMGLPMPDGSHVSDRLIQAGISSFRDFVEHMKQVEADFWGRRFKIYNAWREEIVQEYRENGFLQMLTGFRCSGEMRKNQIINTPIQGSAFHCLLFTFIQLDRIMREEKWKSKLVGQIHDSIVADVHPSELEHIQEVARKIVRVDLPNHWKWIITRLEIDITAYDIDGPWIK